MNEFTSMQADGPHLVLKIDYESRPDPAKIGHLLIAISNDYSKISRGHSLAITSIKTGSVTICLGAAILASVPYAKAAKEFALAGKAIVQLGKLIAGLFEKAKSDPHSIPLFSGKETAGLKTLERMAELTAECGGEFQFEQTGGGSSTKFTMKAPDAKKIATASKKKRGKQKALEKPVISTLAVDSVAPKSKALLSTASVNDVLPFGRSLPKQPSVKELSAMPESDLTALFKILVDMHQQTGSSYILENLVLQLSQHGHEHLSQLLRTEMMKVRQQGTQAVITSRDAD